MSGTLVTVTGRYVLADDTPAQGSVLLTPVVVAGMSADVKRLVTRHSVIGRLDTDGEVELQVLASDDPDWMVDGPVLYEVAEYIAGARGKAYQVVVPGPGPVDLADLQPVDDPQTVAAYPVPGPQGLQGPPGLGIRILSAVPTAADLPATGEDGDAHLVIETGDLWVWGTDGAWHDSGHVQGPPGPPGDAGTLNDLTDVDTTRDATGMVVTRQPDGTYKGQHVRIGLNQLTDVTAPANTPPNSLLGTVGEGTTPGQAEWEPLHLDYIQSTVLGPLPSTVADLGQRVTELEHTGEIVPPDYALTVDLYGGSFTRIIGADVITATPKRITVALAVSPGPNGAVFASLADISGTGAVWADFAGTIGKVVDTSGTSINGASLKEAIRRGQIVTVHRGTDGTHPTLVVERVEDPADAGSSLTLDALKDVTAPANTPTGKVLGTTAVGAWGPVDPPQGAAVTHPNTDDVSVQVWDAGLGRLQRVWYDTGWRDIQTLVDTDFFTATGTGLFLLIRRIGFQINLAFRVAVASSTDPRHTFLPLMVAPGGFAPLQQGVMGPCVIGTGINGADAVAKNAAASTGSVSNFQALTRIDVSAPGVTAPYAPGDVVSGVVIYQTGKTMPSSLPGVMQYPAPD